MEDETSGYLWSEWLRFAQDAFPGQSNIGAECSYWFGVSTVMDRMGQIAKAAEDLNDQDALKLLEEGLKGIAKEIEDFKTRCVEHVMDSVGQKIADEMVNRINDDPDWPNSKIPSC